MLQHSKSNKHAENNPNTSRSDKASLRGIHFRTRTARSAHQVSARQWSLYGLKLLLMLLLERLLIDGVDPLQVSCLLIRHAASLITLGSKRPGSEANVTVYNNDIDLWDVGPSEVNSTRVSAHYPVAHCPSQESSTTVEYTF